MAWKVILITLLECEITLSLFGPHHGRSYGGFTSKERFDGVYIKWDNPRELS